MAIPVRAFVAFYTSVIYKKIPRSRYQERGNELS